MNKIRFHCRMSHFPQSLHTDFFIRFLLFLFLPSYNVMLLLLNLFQPIITKTANALQLVWHINDRICSAEHFILQQLWLLPPPLCDYWGFRKSRDASSRWNSFSKTSHHFFKIRFLQQQQILFSCHILDYFPPRKIVLLSIYLCAV